MHFKQENIQDETDTGVWLEIVAGYRNTFLKDKHPTEYSSTQDQHKCDVKSTFYQEEPLITDSAEIQFQRELPLQNNTQYSYDHLNSHNPNQQTYDLRDEQYQVISSHQLKQSFPIIDLSPHKATNAPKFLYGAFYLKIQQELPINNEYDVHLQWINRYYKRHIKDKTITRYHLIDLFGGTENCKRNQRRTKDRCAILQRKLIFSKLQLILHNNMIPRRNKLNYLYLSKIYEWRLNTIQLVGRFN